MEGKIFNCPIHGHIELSPLSVKIIDTPQFQRLRDISQLGGVYYVFPGAASKRFEHCIGVAYLARYFIDKLHLQQPELGITLVDILCVEIAGLCHDLGHGPFSHLFDGKVLPQLGVTDFVHEHASIGILDILIEENDLMAEFSKFGLTRADVHFIKELILGDEHEAPAGFQWIGRGEKTFLYDIVANKRNGIDVDKFDYFARDCHVLGVSKSFDCLRLMKFARVHRVVRDSQGHSDRSSLVAGQLEICFHKKEAWNLFELFHTRYALHKRAYQHKVAACVELMISEAFVLASPYLLVPGEGGAPRTLAECVTDFHAYWRLGEYLLKEIENSFRPELATARAIITRLRKRDMMVCAREILLEPQGTGEALRRFSSGEVKKEILAIKNASADRETIGDNDLFVSIIKLGYGKGGSDPVSELTTFYRPVKPVADTDLVHDDSSLEAVVSVESSWEIGSLPRETISRLIPKEFEETYIRLYCRFKHQAPVARALFDQWCSLKALDDSSVYFQKKRSRLNEDSLL